MSDIFAPVKYKTNPLRLIFYAIFFSLMLFLLLPISRMFQDYYRPDELVRTIELVTTPSPPPRQQELEQTEVIEDVITIEKVNADIEVEPLKLKLEASLEGELKVQIALGSFNVKQGKVNLIADIKMFTLSELDTTPTSLNDPLLRIPSELEEQGVNDISAEALVILTEEGRVEFMQFISISHQGARQAIRYYIQKLRYTPPTKDGEVGRVRFRLPIMIRGTSELTAQEKRDQKNKQYNSAKQPNN